MKSNIITLTKPIVKKNDEMAVSSIETPQQLIAFLQGTEGRVLLRNACCEVWVPVSLILPSGSVNGNMQIIYFTTSSNPVYQLNVGVDIIGVSVDGQTYYPTSTFPAQQYTYDVNTGELEFTVAPSAGLNISIMYIV